jgi:ribosomal protein L24E
VPGRSPHAVAVPLPPGIGNVYVREDSMVFVASETRME